MQPAGTQASCSAQTGMAMAWAGGQTCQALLICSGAVTAGCSEHKAAVHTVPGCLTSTAALCWPKKWGSLAALLCWLRGSHRGCRASQLWTPEGMCAFSHPTYPTYLPALVSIRTLSQFLTLTIISQLPIYSWYFLKFYF